MGQDVHHLYFDILTLENWDEHDVPKRRQLPIIPAQHSRTSKPSPVQQLTSEISSSDTWHAYRFVYRIYQRSVVDSNWNVMTHGDAREGKWRGNWRMEWVSSTLHTTSEHCVSSTTTADAHTSAASSRLNWHPRRFKWNRPFRRKTKFGFCACAITFQTQSIEDVWFGV